MLIPVPIYQETERILAACCRLVITILLVSVLVSVPPAQTGQAQGSRDSNTPGDLEAFVDGMVTRQMAEYHIPGAIVSVVKDGRALFAKGYGHTSPESGTPVSGQETLFRIGSTSKIFTWTAVMQLAEQGRLDLDADVNTYLTDFKIPATYPQPVTLRSLFSHTAGFEERLSGMLAHSSTEMLSLHDYLAQNMPARARPPGQLTAYSNYGCALAGYIVEVVSGLPFDQYIEQNIFAPLNMVHSTLRQPPPPGLKEKTAQAYYYLTGYEQVPYLYINATPEGAMSTTAADMANFMLAHLQDGKLGKAQILSPETTRLMHSHLFSNDKRLDGFAYGFFDGEENGLRFLKHGGGFPGWHTMLALLPDKEMGFFVSYNAEGGLEAVEFFFQEFLDYVAPESQTEVKPDPALAPSQRLDIAGDYRSTRTATDHIDKLSHFTGAGYAKISYNPDNTISVSMTMGRNMRNQTFIEVEPFVFKALGGSDNLIYHPAQDRRRAYIQLDSRPHFALERIQFHETTRFNLALFATCLIFLISAPLAALGGKVTGLFRKKTTGQTRLASLARRWAWGLSLGFLALILLVMTVIYPEIQYPFPKSTAVILAMILFACILAVGPVAFAVIAWKRRFWSRAGRIHYTLITLALLGMVWLMYYWRLLGFRY